jgi:predicted dehydrogenase/threonine dehydrogenase-like Zn-dependent dehydrogenase
MRVLLQNFGSGAIELIQSPVPVAGAGEILVRTTASVVSPGTERMLVAFAQAPLWKKVLSQPARVRQVMQKARAEGIATALEAVRARLDTPLAPGYAATGYVMAVGSEVQGIAPGERVAAAGPHAEYFVVPATLAVRIPDGVADAKAAFASIGAIALQAVRLAQCGPGSAVGVIGLGTVGLLAAQLLRASGCRAFGLDLDAGAVEVARGLGIDAQLVSPGVDATAAAESFSRGRGLDAVLVATDGGGSAPIDAACRMARPKARIVLLGTAEIAVPRELLYRKELELVVSSSYGPGRHEAGYLAGHDWPVEAVRWTAQRNMEAFLDLVAAGAVDLTPLSRRSVPFDALAEAYAGLGAGGAGFVVAYPGASDAAPPPPQPSPASREREQQGELATLPSPSPAKRGRVGEGAAGHDELGLAVIGAGTFATRSLIPHLLASGAQPRVVVSARGISAAVAARRFGFRAAANDLDAALDDPAVGMLAIATPHHTHATLALRALQAGRHVWVEKPLALKLADVDAIEAVLAANPDLLLTVGFNRRFAPDTLSVLAALAGQPGPRAITIEVAAPSLPPEHWLRDPAIGGGALLGEGCHFVDLACCLARSLPERIRAVPSRDGGAVALGFADGSTAAIHYLAGAHPSVAKERITVHAGGRTLVIENFRRLVTRGVPGQRTQLLPRMKPDKGHAALAQRFVAACRNGGPPPIPHAELLAVSRAAIRALHPAGSAADP